jgi:hypothetical protein
MAISEKPWSNITAADYPTPAAYCEASLIDLNTGRDKAKGNCKLPIYEPGGALNRAAVHAAAAVLAGGRGGVDAPPDAKRAAARKLVSAYRQLEEDAPDAVKRLAAG